MSSSNECCKKFAYGWLTSAPIALGFLGSIFAWAALASCSFLIAKTDIVDFGVGFLKYQDPEVKYLTGAETCDEYESYLEDYLDAAFKFGKAMGIISGIFGLVLSILSTILCCIAFPSIVVKIMGGAYLVVALASILMLVFLATDACDSMCNLYSAYCDSCSLKMGTGAYLAIVSFLFLVGAGVTTFFLKERGGAGTCQGQGVATTKGATKDEEKAAPESALPTMNSGAASTVPTSVAPMIEIVEEINDDGTKTITKTITKINPDGSKDVHKTIEKVFMNVPHYNMENIDTYDE
jgi:hypothetical protein